MVILIFLLYQLFIFYFLLNNNVINEYVYSKIMINNTNNISKMFIKSVELYNKRIVYNNNIYNKIRIFKEKNKNAIIVLLNYNEIKPFIARNFNFLKQNYHDRLIFYVTERITSNEVYRNIKYNVIDISDVFFKFPYNFNSSNFIPNFVQRGKWNYQHMIRFFFRDIFLHPSLSDVDLYMRLDSDSVLNTTINLFKLMNKHVVYMHNKILNDAPSVVKGLKQFTHSLVKVLKVNVKDKRKYRLTFKKTALIYYNNFEICRMNFFRSVEMFQFINLIDLSYGQFIYRWGDAPLRYISLSLFAENYSKISLPKSVIYCHQGC